MLVFRTTPSDWSASQTMRSRIRHWLMDQLPRHEELASWPQPRYACKFVVGLRSLERDIYQHLRLEELPERIGDFNFYLQCILLNIGFRADERAPCRSGV